MMPTDLTSWERFTVTFGPLFPLLTGALGAVLAAIIAAGMAWHTSKRHNEQMKAERVAAKKRDKAAWKRQRSLFADQRAADMKMLELKNRGEEQADVRARAILHAERLLAPLGELRGLASTYNRFGAKTDRDRETQALAIFETMQIDVSYLDKELRDRIAILLRIYTAMTNIGQPGYVERPQGFFLRRMVEDTQENLMSRIRGETLAPLSPVQAKIEQSYQYYVEYDDWLMIQAELAAERYGEEEEQRVQEEEERRIALEEASRMAYEAGDLDDYLVQPLSDDWEPDYSNEAHAFDDDGNRYVEEDDEPRS